MKVEKTPVEQGQPKDDEDLRLEASSEFWRMIEERRRDLTVRLRDVEAELFSDDE